MPYLFPPLPLTYSLYLSLPVLLLSYTVRNERLVNI
jgi:hypothetical protein